MAENKASASAGGVALMRAIETEKPEALRICDDPIATAMLPNYSRFTLWAFKAIIKSAFYDRLSTGFTGSSRNCGRRLCSLVVYKERICLLGADDSGQSHGLLCISRDRQLALP